MSRVERRKGKKKRFRKLFGIGIVFAIAAAYAGGAFYFNTHYFPNTTVEGIDIGMMTSEQAKQHINNKLSTYELTIAEGETQETMSAVDAGLEYSNIDSIDEILASQSYYTWFIDCTKTYSYKQLDTKVDTQKISASVDTLKIANPETPTESVNASIIYDKDKKSYVIKEATLGNILNKEQFIIDVADAITGLEKAISTEDGRYFVQPTITSQTEALVNAQSVMNKYLGGTIVYKDGGKKVKLTKADIAGMISYNENYDVSIDKAKVKTFITDNVAKTFNSVTGKVPSGLTAWKVDVSKEVTKTLKNIKSGKSAKRQPIYSQEGFDREDSDIGNTYIDVNLGDQCMWYVEDGEILLTSDVVTGCLATGHGTSTGFYHIAYKQRNHTMVKYNSFVSYWMPYNTTVGIGFHDASWRSSFGGSIYKTDGSHGCINMPTAKAAKLYSLISAGTPVYVHY